MTDLEGQLQMQGQSTLWILLWKDFTFLHNMLKERKNHITHLPLKDLYLFEKSKSPLVIQHNILYHSNPPFSKETKIDRFNVIHNRWFSFYFAIIMGNSFTITMDKTTITIIKNLSIIWWRIIHYNGDRTIHQNKRYQV